VDNRVLEATERFSKGKVAGNIKNRQAVPHVYICRLSRVFMKPLNKQVEVPLHDRFLISQSLLGKALSEETSIHVNFYLSKAWED